MYFGLLIWVVAGFAVWRSVDARRDTTSPSHTSVVDPNRGLIPTLWTYATQPPRRVTLDFRDPVQLSVGDPILLGGGGDRPDLGAVRQVGQIKRVLDPETHLPVRKAETRTAEALFYASAPIVSGRARLTYYEMPDSLAWVADTLLPAEKRRRIAREIRTAIEAHQADVLASLQPVIEQSLRDGITILEQDLADAVKASADSFKEFPVPESTGVF